jgi:pimeloyl-ACP methyl ester carboxylesterase
MEYFLTSQAFQRVPCSYNATLPYLEFVTRTEITDYSGHTIYHIPIRYYQIDLHDTSDSNSSSSSSDLVSSNDSVSSINSGDLINSRLVMLMCHGNGEDIGHTDPCEIAHKFGVDVCTFDYAGYGLHDCKISSESACQKDVLTVYNYLIQNKGFLPENIIIHGRSLGSAMACYLAHHLCICEQVPRGLILVAPLMSAIMTVFNLKCPWDIFVNYNLAPFITCPTLIIHGDRDTIVPYWCGVELSKLFPKLDRFITLTGLGHSDMWVPDYYDGITDFVKKLSGEK